MKSCPAGWHLPKDAEWDKLYRSADGTNDTKSPYNSKTAGKFLKSANGWTTDNSKTAGKFLKSANGLERNNNGVDKFGFSALPGGLLKRDRFIGVGGAGYWWSASDEDKDYARQRLMFSDENASSDKDDKSMLISVRCIKD
jgi:uncharacterized protein (TIGR02145 family)